MSKNNLQHFDTMRDLITACDEPVKHPQTWPEGRRASRSLESSTGDFYGTKNYPEAVYLAVNGWPEGLKEISSRMAVMNKTGQMRMIVNDFIGTRPDVARFVAGLPDCMFRKKFAESNKAPCLDIVINASRLAVVSASQIMNYGAAIGGLIDSLENMGYSLSITVSSYAMLSGKIPSGFMLTVKKHGDALDLGKMIFCIGHPSFQRRLGFSFREVNHSRETVGYGYGRSIDIPQQYRGDIYFPRQDSLEECNDVEGAINKVREIVKATHPDILAEAA